MNFGYNILFSRDSIGFPYIKDRLQPLVSPHDKVVVIPWAFPIEISEKEFSEEFFPRYGKRYERDVAYLREVGIKDENIFIANCYKHSTDRLKEEIAASNIIILPGGNPVMLSNKIIECGILEDLRNYPNIIMGGSAGACIQFPRYFITEENNGPRGFQELNGLGILDVDFMIDVHTNIHTTGENGSNCEKYMANLVNLSRHYQRDIYAISDDGALWVDREKKGFKTYGNVQRIVY